MFDGLRRGRRSSRRGIVVLCVCLGLLFLTRAGEGAETVVCRQRFEPKADSNQRDTKVTLTCQPPAGFQSAGGDARLLSSIDRVTEAGEFTLSKLDGKPVVEAEFMMQRGWKVEKQYDVIELDGREFNVKPIVPIDEVRPRKVNIEPGVQPPTDNVQFFRIWSSVALENGAELCSREFRLRQGNLRVDAKPVTIGEKGLDVQIAVQRPNAKTTDAELILDVCLDRSRWMYVGQLQGLIPVSAPVETTRAEIEAAPRESPESNETAPDEKISFWSRAKSILVYLWEHVKAHQLAWSLIALGLFVCTAYLAYRYWQIRPPSPVTPPRPEQPRTPPAPTAQNRPAAETLGSKLSEALQQELAPLEGGIKDLRSRLIALQEQLSGLSARPKIREVEGGEDKEASNPIVESSSGGSESNLAELVNRWWREGADRARADFLLQSPSVKAYRSVNIHDSLRNLTNRTFTFQVTDGPMEWLGRQQQGDLWLVPCDPRQFETGDSLKFLGALFDGLGRSLEKIRFRRVVRPCRLQRDPSSQDRYRLVQSGQIEMEGQAEAASAALAVQPVALARVPQASPSAPAGLSETKLARIVQDAVVEAVPKNLPSRIEELTRHIRSLQDSGSPRAEPARPDPNLFAALDAMRKGVAEFDGELRAHAMAIQEVKSLVEALRGDLLRMERELRHRDPAPPVSRGSFFSKPEEVFEIDAAVDRLGEGPAQLLPQENRYEMGVSPWRSTEPVHVPEQVLDKLEKWWPARLPASESGPDGDQLPEPSAYLWRLEETKRVLARVCRQRGWDVSLIHLSVPEGSAQGDASLQITEPVTVSRDYRSASFRGSSFSDALLFQFALSIHGDAGRHIALLPAAGLRVDRHHHAYSRLTLGKLPESATRLTQVIRPAVLSPAGQGGLYTVASPLKADFR